MLFQIIKNRSERICEAIQKSGYSYGELSNLTGIPKSALQRYATGETTKVPIDRIQLISKYTNVSFTYLMGLEDCFSENILTKSKELEELETLYLSLNEVGKQKVLDIIKDYSKIYSI